MDSVAYVIKWLASESIETSHKCRNRSKTSTGVILSEIYYNAASSVSVLHYELLYTALKLGITHISIKI